MARSCLIILLFAISFTGKIYGQCEPLVPPTSDCESAPAICFNQVCFTTGNEPQVCCNNWCGNNTIINNPQFFSFVPNQPDAEIDIHVDDCTNGTGLQSAILDACPWDNANVITCEPGINPGGTMVLVASGLIPFQPYWILIDGSNGAECHYTFTKTSGIDFPPLPDTLDATQTFPSVSLVCPGYQDLVLTTGPDLTGAYYLWTLGWDGELLVSTGPSIALDLDPDAPEGQWDICVRAFTGCDTTESVCFEIEIGNSPAIVKDNAIFCQEAFPFQWQGQTINGPGQYAATFTDDHQCSYDSTWTILAYPVYPPGMIDTFVCSPQFNYRGQIFDHSGQYDIVLEGENVNGCDSMVELHLEIGASDQFVEVGCENDSMILTTHIISQDENIDTVTFEWYSCDFDTLLSTGSNFMPSNTGCYSLVINSSLCRDTISSNYNNENCMMNDECDFLTSPVCVGVPTILTTAMLVPSGAQIFWLVAIEGGLPNYTFAGSKDSLHATFLYPGDYFFSYTIVDSTDTWTCHDNIEALAGPEVSICCDVFTCDSCAFITLTNYSPEGADVQLTNGISTFVAGNSTMYVEICSPEGFPTDIGIGGIESFENGCPGSIVGDTFITINQFPPFKASIVPSVDSLCTIPIDLASYQWTYCDSTTVLSIEPCFAPPTSGCYCLVVEDELGCTAKSCTDFIIISTSSIPENELRISPNPSSGLVQIELFQPTLYPAYWQLTDLQGVNILDGVLIEQSNELDFTSLPSGIYFLKIKSKSNGALIRKIVIE